MDSRPLRILLFVGFVILMIITIVVVVVTLVKLNDNSSGSGPTDNESCQNNRMDSVDIFRKSHQGCTVPLPFVQGCPDNPQGEWILFERSNFAWEKSDQLRSHQKNEYPAVVVSPVFNVSSASCSIQISVSFPSNSKGRLFLTSPHANDSFVQLTSGPCHHHVIDDLSLLSELKSFQIIILSDLPQTAKVLMGSVSSQSCYSYETIAEEPNVSQNPTFPFVPRGTRNRCSSEIINETVDCDWHLVTNLGSGKFVRQETHSCIVVGLNRRPENDDIWFLSLSSDQSETQGYVISPIVEGGTSHLLLSFWYISQCSGTKLRIYLIPSSRDVGGVTGEIPFTHEIADLDLSFEWVFASFEIEIPESYTAYQVVLEGILTANGNCSGHKCYTASGTASGEPQSPMLALDEMTLEAKFEPCYVSDNTSFLDCAFQAEDNSSTTCAWSSAAPPGVPDDFKDLFAVWKLNNQPDRNGALSVTQQHLEGRGYILTFLSSNNGFGNHFRSPVLVANSNCSCKMSFFFLLQGNFAPRLQVNILLGDDPGVSAVWMDQRPVLPQWSVFGHQSSDWVMADILLNLPSSDFFQVEIRARDIVDLRGGASLDDIFFSGCDFRAAHEES